MNTLKSVAVIAVLLAVLYGVFVSLNKPLVGPPETARQEDELAPPLVDFAPAETAQPIDKVSPTGQPSTLPPGYTIAPDSGGSKYAGSTISGTYRAGPTAPDALPPATPPLDTAAPGLPTEAPPGDPQSAAAPGVYQRSSYEVPSTNGAVSSAAPALENAAPPASEASAASPAPADQTALAAYSLRRDWQAAEELLNQNRCREALAVLSPHYLQPHLAESDRAQLVAWLDALAAKVIYSREHWLAAPHKVRTGETLFDLATQHKVAWQLLQNVNNQSVTDPAILVPGTELKVIAGGPFRGDVNLATSEMTLFLGDLYAGRFPFTLGNEPPQAGTFQVVDKRPDRTYYGPDGNVVAANDPANPYGGCWISLGGEACLHGSPASAASQGLGCVSLSPQDAKDVYGILSIGSEVTIRR